MENPVGIFRNSDTTLSITSSPKDFSDIVSPVGEISAASLGALFGRALAADVGKATMTKGEIIVELTYTYSKGFMTTKDLGGNESTFAYRFDKLYYLDPAGEYTIILGR
jgi:hypothetical protein